MRVPAQFGRAVVCLAVSASIAVGSVVAAVAQAPYPPADAFADVPPVTVKAQAGTIRAKLLGGTWATPSGQVISTTPARCLELGRRQTLAVRSRAWFDIVLREPVARVQVYALTDSEGDHFLRVLPDAKDPLRWHVRGRRLRRGAPPTRTNIEVSYTRGRVFYQFLSSPARAGQATTCSRSA